MQGKLHPSEFKHGKHKHRDLPQDPMFAGKSMRDIIAMLDRGELDGDRFVPFDSKTQHLQRPSLDRQVDMIKEESAKASGSRFA